MKLITLIQAFFLTGSIALDVTGTATYSDTPFNGDSIHVEAGGILNVLDAATFIISSLTVAAYVQFFLRTEVQSTLDVGSIDNSDYALFYMSSNIYPPFRGSNRNSGQLVVYSSTVNVDIFGLANTGSIIFWGSFGLINIYQGNSSGNMCFSRTTGQLNSPSGNGCFALSQGFIYVTSAQPDFAPTVVFSGGNNGFGVQSGPQVPYIKFINFGINDLSTVPADGYDHFEYSDGSVILYFATSQVVLDIGTGYDPTMFYVYTIASLVYVKYSLEPPSGSNKGACSCVLNSNPPPPVVPSEPVEGETTVPESTEPETTVLEIETATEPETTTIKIETTTEQEEETTSVIISTPNTSDCGHDRKWKPWCQDDGHFSGHGSSHNNDHNPGHGIYNNGKGKDHSDDHGKDNNKGHGNDKNNNEHGNKNNNGHGKGNDKDDGKGNNKGKNDNNHGNGNDKDRTNGPGNGNNNDRGNDHNNGNGKDNGNKGKGHNREVVSGNSASLIYSPGALMIVLVWLSIV